MLNRHQFLSLYLSLPNRRIKRLDGNHISFRRFGVHRHAGLALLDMTWDGPTWEGTGCHRYNADGRAGFYSRASEHATTIRDGEERKARYSTIYLPYTLYHFKKACWLLFVMLE